METTSGWELQILDRETMTRKQTLSLGMENCPDIWETEGLLVLRNDDRLTALIPESGQYRIWMEDDLYPMGEESTDWYGKVLAFNGEKLAIAGYYTNWEGGSSCLLIYDETGLQYAGHYAHNADNLQNPMRNEWPDSLKLQWNN